MIRDAKELSPDQRAAIESLLGRHMLEDEAVRFVAQRQPVSPEEAGAILDGALRSPRPDCRLIR